MDEETRREIILEHYMQPLHKHKTEDTSYEMVNTNNSSCIDNLDIYVQIKDNIINDICFEGEACAISTSSTSIMIRNLIGKTIDEALNYIENFENMLNEKPYDENILEEGLVYQEIYKQGNRKHCAYLPMKVLKKCYYTKKRRQNSGYFVFFLPFKK